MSFYQCPTPHLEQCDKCGVYKHPMAECGCETNFDFTPKPVDYYTISVDDLMKADKRVSELEDKVRILEEALEESESELAYKEAQLTIVLDLAHKAHDLRVTIDRLQPYKDQYELPLGDMPQ